MFEEDRLHFVLQFFPNSCKKYVLQVSLLNTLSRSPELKLVEVKDRKHMQTYLEYFKADVDIKEMKRSDSKDKYIHGRCVRKTFILTHGTELNTQQNFWPWKRVRGDPK